MSWLSRLWRPSFEGQRELTFTGAEFFARLEARVARGLLPGSPAGRRNRYRFELEAVDRALVEAENDWTAFNVGLNRIELSVRAGPDGALLDYRVSYQRWFHLALMMSSVFLLGGVALFFALPLLPDVGRQGMSVELGRVVVLGMGLFWGLIWPVLLARMHRAPSHRLWRSILDELASG